MFSETTNHPCPYVDARFPALRWTCVPSHVEFGIHNQNMLIRHLILGTSTIKTYTECFSMDATIFFTQNRVDDILKPQLIDISNFPPYVWPYPTAPYVTYCTKHISAQVGTRAASHVCTTHLNYHTNRPAQKIHTNDTHICL